MNRVDPDIVAVRDLPPGTVEPTDESVSRTWYALARRQAPPARARFRRWVPAGAALVVAGLAVTGVVLIPDGGADPGIGVGAAPSASANPKTGDPLATAPTAGGAKKPGLPVGPPPALGSSTSINARESLDRLAAKAASSPTQTLQPGQLIYTRMYGLSSSANIGDDAGAATAADETELWLRPEGMTPVKSTRNGAENHVDANAGTPVDKPYIWQPTPEWLAALPTQPAALRKELLDGIHNSKWSDDHTLGKEIGELLVSSEPLLRAEVRVAMLKSIKSWKGLSARETTFDGKKVWAIRQSEKGSFNELLFDPTTGRAVGRANGMGTTISYQVLWTHKLVGKAGDR